MTGLDPNGQGGLPDGVVWPEYGSGGDVGQDLVLDVGESYVEDDDWREEGMAWFMKYALTVIGS